MLLLRCKHAHASPDLHLVDHSGRHQKVFVFIDGPAVIQVYKTGFVTELSAWFSVRFNFPRTNGRTR